ncbi:hypothetical protein BG015_003473 [Linnemannia schmuckeri]|uniref:Uncharacterized protein n=1 Tax=Linnemannia schmuckeri TaxID=64567 RepID=A0A9P5VD83_9FUNG|nr:hypothetical protein BG015_003473 [Linnemannia schmuckeri]
MNCEVVNLVYDKPVIVFGADLNASSNTHHKSKPCSAKHCTNVTSTVHVDMDRPCSKKPSKQDAAVTGDASSDSVEEPDTDGISLILRRKMTRCRVPTYDEKSDDEELLLGKKHHKHCKHHGIMIMATIITGENTTNTTNTIITTAITTRSPNALGSTAAYNFAANAVYTCDKIGGKPKFTTAYVGGCRNGECIILPITKTTDGLKTTTTTFALRTTTTSATADATTTTTSGATTDVTTTTTETTTDDTTDETITITTTAAATSISTATTDCKTDGKADTTEGTTTITAATTTPDGVATTMTATTTALAVVTTTTKSDCIPLIEPIKNTIRDLLVTVEAYFDNGVDSAGAIAVTLAATLSQIVDVIKGTQKSLGLTFEITDPAFQAIYDVVDKLTKASAALQAPSLIALN